MNTRLLSILGFLTTSAFAQLTFEKSEDLLTVRNGGQLIFTYRTDQRVPCLYPLHGPDGTNITRHYPFKKGVAGEQDDHPHHLSFWTAHGKVNDVDFWHDPEARITHNKYHTDPDTSIPGSLKFEVLLDWTKDEQNILREKRSYLLRVLPDSYLIEQFSEFHPAVEDVVFGDTKEGFIGLRLTPTLRLKGKVAKGRIINADGLTDHQVWGKRSKWVAYHGPNSKGNPTVVGMMDHPKNLRHPTWWHARDYGLLAANPFGIHDFEGKKKQPNLGDYTLRKGTKIEQRYRLLLHAGDLDIAKINDIFVNW